MGFFGKNNSQQFKVIKGRTYEFYKSFFDRKYAKLRGEELKLSGDIKYYRVEDAEEGEGFNLWIH